VKHSLVNKHNHLTLTIVQLRVNLFSKAKFVSLLLKWSIKLIKICSDFKDISGMFKQPQINFCLHFRHDYRE